MVSNWWEKTENKYLKVLSFTEVKTKYKLKETLIQKSASLLTLLQNDISVTHARWTNKSEEKRRVKDYLTLDSELSSTLEISCSIWWAPARLEVSAINAMIERANFMVK